MPGPVLVSWATAVTTLSLQASLTDWALVSQDAALFWGHFSEQLSGDRGESVYQDISLAPEAALYAFIWVNIVGACFFLMPFSFPVQRSEPDGNGMRVAMEVPRRSRDMAQHQINAVDCSYIALNTLCMPGFFYHFYCLVRSWGLDPAAPPLHLDSAAALGQLVGQPGSKRASMRNLNCRDSIHACRRRQAAMKRLQPPNRCLCV